MIQKIKNLILAFSLLATFASPALLPAAATYAMPKTVYANTFTNQECSGSNFDLTGKSTDCTDANGSNGIGGKIKTLLNLLSAVVGIVAVIMIIYAGFRYVTSAGSESGVKTAKNAIIYAIIGLVVVAFAQIIVHFVITNVT